MYFRTHRVHIKTSTNILKGMRKQEIVPRGVLPMKF